MGARLTDGSTDVGPLSGCLAAAVGWDGRDLEGKKGGRENGEEVNEGRRKK